MFFCLCQSPFQGESVLLTAILAMPLGSYFSQASPALNYLLGKYRNGSLIYKAGFLPYCTQSWFQPQFKFRSWIGISIPFWMAHNPNTHTLMYNVCKHTNTLFLSLSAEAHHDNGQMDWQTGNIVLFYILPHLCTFDLKWYDVLISLVQNENHLSLKMEKRFSWHRLSEAEAVDPLDTLLWCQSRYKSHEPHRKQTIHVDLTLSCAAFSLKVKRSACDTWPLALGRSQRSWATIKSGTKCESLHTFTNSHTLTNPHTHTQSVRCLTCHVFLCRYFLSNEAGFSHRHLYRWDTLMLRRPRCFYSSSITLVTAAWPLIPRVSTVEPFHRECLSCSVF